MAYGAPQGPLYPLYRVSFRHDGITAQYPMGFYIEVQPDETLPEDADAIFQKLLDMIDSHPDFYLTDSPEKRYTYRQVVTPS